MLFVKATTRGLFGGYFVLSLLVAFGALTRMHDPVETLAYLEKARWIPGAARLEMTLRDAYGYARPSVQMVTAPEIEPAPEPEPKAAPKTIASPLAESTQKLTPLQELRQRTYGSSSQTTLARK